MNTAKPVEILEDQRDGSYWVCPFCEKNVWSSKNGSTCGNCGAILLIVAEQGKPKRKSATLRIDFGEHRKSISV